MNPCRTALDIDVRPFQCEHVGLAQSRG
jgi:hypothetical protein